MKILFSHQNYPAQFGAFGDYLARQGWDVTFFTGTDRNVSAGPCKLYRMKPHREPTKGVHRFAKPLEQAMINGQAFANAAIQAREQGLEPDIVVAHSGWGSGTFAKAVWPNCKYVSYVEWYYRWPPEDSVLANSRSTDEDGRAKALARNAPTMLDFAEADLVMCPTHFQASQFPDWLRERVTVMHDGVDTRYYAPAENVAFPVDDAIPADAEVITYATRGMEPHRGFPEFMQAVALLQKSRPRLHAIIGGTDRVAYGPQLPEGQSWKQIMLEKLELDESRLHWPGLLPKEKWRTLLQSTDVHVYLSVPFVLSWSMIEAMSAACPLVVSDTSPVQEAIRGGDVARVVNHRDIEALAAAIASLLDDRELAGRLGQGARALAERKYASSWIYPARARMLAELVES